MPHNILFDETLHELVTAILDEFSGRITLVSSFGAESAVLLHMVSRINPATPILFNETGMLFPETLTYQKGLADDFGLTNVRLIRPTGTDLKNFDPDGDLHKSDNQACCHVRKVLPLQRALSPYDAWITGRKRYQSKSRANLPKREFDDARRLKLNPLAEWTADDVKAYFDTFDLPAHPLVKSGFKSIGCSPCTTVVKQGEDARAGRWRGSEKTECGIHFVNGKAVRLSNSENYS